MTWMTPTEFKGDATEDKPEQHRDDERIRCRQNDCICQWKDRKEPTSAHDKPGFVAVPDRCDRVHRLVAFTPDRQGREQNADTEVETIQHDISHDREPDDAGPYESKIDAAHRVYSDTMGSEITPAAGVIPVARSGIRAGSSSPGPGGFDINRRR